MGTGNYERALTRLQTRVSSSMFTQVIKGLQGVLNGDDNTAYFYMLLKDLKELELQRLRLIALKRPPKIKKYSFLLLVCMLLIYLGTIGYQILGTMSGMF